MKTRSRAALIAVAALLLLCGWLAREERFRPSLEFVPVVRAHARGGARSDAVLRGVETGEHTARVVAEVGASVDSLDAGATAAAPTAGHLVLRVTDRSGRPMSQTPWGLVSSRALGDLMSPVHRERVTQCARWRATADDLGIARFDDVPAGEWGILPHFDGVTAPLCPIDADEFVVEIVAGETTHADLEVMRMAVIHGFVHLTDGRSEVTWLRATSRSIATGHPFQTLDEITEGDGTFRMFVPAGVVRLETQSWGVDSILRTVVAPPAQWLVLHEGDSRFVEFTFGAGRTHVTGRVVDQHGRPWSGLRAELHAARVEPVAGDCLYGTRVGASLVDEQGSFTFDALPEGRYTVTFAHSASDFPAPGGVGEYPVPATFRADGVCAVDVGTSLVFRWESVRVEGFVLRSDGRAADQLRLRVELPPWNRITSRPSNKPVERRVRIGLDGRFTFDYSSHVPGTLTCVLSGSSGELRTVVPFEVGEARDQALTLIYP